MKKILLLLVISITSINLSANENEKMALSEKFLTISKTERVLNTTLQQYEDQLTVNFTPEQKAKFKEIMYGSLGWEVIKDQLTTLVANTYTKEELEAFIAFLSTPTGASANEKTEEFSKQFAILISQNMKSVISKMQETQNKN